MVRPWDNENVPNAETIAAIEEAQDESNLEFIHDVKKFFADL
ncbi:MAG TPA: hypothetical protein VFM60_02450 [Salinimicrobium sp.]|nr:hypothetical protein [Salinimicrobium sp.]